MQRALSGVQQLSWPERSPDLSPADHVWDMMQRERTGFPETATTISDLQQQVQGAWNNLSQDYIRHLYDRLHARIHDCVVSRGVYCVLMCMFGHPLLWHVCFIWSEFIICLYNNKLHVTSIYNTMNLSLKGLHFIYRVFHGVLPPVTEHVPDVIWKHFS